MALHGYAGKILHLDLSAPEGERRSPPRSTAGGAAATAWAPRCSGTSARTRRSRTAATRPTSSASARRRSTARSRRRRAGAATWWASASASTRRAGTRARASAAASRRCSSTPAGTPSSSRARPTSRRGSTSRNDRVDVPRRRGPLGQGHVGDPAGDLGARLGHAARASRRQAAWQATRRRRSATTHVHAEAGRAVHRARRREPDGARLPDPRRRATAPARAGSARSGARRT